MKFWDSSAVVPLLFDERETSVVRRLVAADPDVAVWALTSVEAWSAVARRRRDHGLPSPQLREARGRLSKMSAAWTEVPDGAEVRRTAMRLLDQHALRAADALQLAAAVVAASGDPTNWSS